VYLMSGEAAQITVEKRGYLLIDGFANFAAVHVCNQFCSESSEVHGQH